MPPRYRTCGCNSSASGGLFALGVTGHIAVFGQGTPRQSKGLSAVVDRLVRVSRRISTLLVVFVTLALAVVASFTVRVPLVAMGPGPVFDTLGTVEVPESSADDPMGGAGGTVAGEGGEGDEDTVVRPIVEIIPKAR